VGDRQQVTDARTDEAQLLEVAAIYRVTDPDALVWWGEPPVADADTERGALSSTSPCWSTARR
jgi:hypothetical protein